MRLTNTRLASVAPSFVSPGELASRIADVIFSGCALFASFGTLGALAVLEPRGAAELDRS
jgi:hypothetical protein